MPPKTARATARKRATATKARKPSKSAAAGRRANPRPKPQAARRDDLIIRQGFVIDATGRDGPRAIPEVLIIGNADGYQYLAELFTALAAAARPRHKSPIEGLQLRRGEGPFDQRFSDDFELRFVPVNAANRAATLKKLGVTQVSRQSGSLFERYQEVATQFGRLTALMKRETARDAKRDELP